METSKCKCCEKTKPIEEFYWRDKKRGIPTTYCKACNKANIKKWRKTPEGKAKWYAYDEKRRNSNKEWLKEQRSKGCEKCGESRFYVIDFHHKDPSSKTFTIGQTDRWTITQLKKEIKKCIRLCANCHREVHYLEQNKLDN
jgi:predicted HNH restriction endonuclease